jgi:hypothetical protein
MQFPLLPFLAFHVRRIRTTQPVLFVTLILSIVAFVGALCASLTMAAAGNEALARYHALKVAPAKAPTPVDVLPERGETLRPFSSAQMVTALNEVGARVGVVVNELTFTFDEGKTEPFSRYRASMTLNANYLAVRRYVDQVRADIPDTSLDSISCTRKGIEDAVVTCELAFTAFFKKEERG